MLAMGIGCKRDRHSAVGLFHKSFQLARARGEISAKVPVSLALILLRATIAFENTFDLRPREELEESISRAAEDATARDRKGKTLSIGDRVRSRWMGGTRWWNGKIVAVLTASSVDIRYDDGDFETGVNSRQFVELLENSSGNTNSGSSTTSTSHSGEVESWWLWAGRPIARSLVVGEQRFDKIPKVERDDVVRFVLFCLICIVALIVILISIVLGMFSW